MTTASTVAVPLLFAAAVVGIFVGLVIIMRRDFRRDDQIIVPAYTLVGRYPLPQAEPAPTHGTAHIGTPARHRAPTARAITAVPGYGRHSLANAVGCDSQRAPEENTGALDRRAMAALLEVRS